VRERKEGNIAGGEEEVEEEQGRPIPTMSAGDDAYFSLMEASALVTNRFMASNTSGVIPAANSSNGFSGNSSK